MSIEREVGRGDADWAVEGVEEERQEGKAGGEAQKRMQELAVMRKLLQWLFWIFIECLTPF